MATNVNDRMQQIAEYAVRIASDKFGKWLDYTENSLENLEALLQQAYEQNNAHGIPEEAILKTARVWGGYLGEIIRRKWGGEWVLNRTEIDLIIHVQVIHLSTKCINELKLEKHSVSRNISLPFFLRRWFSRILV